MGVLRCKQHVTHQSCVHMIDVEFQSAFTPTTTQQLYSRCEFLFQVHTSPVKMPLRFPNFKKTLRPAGGGGRGSRSTQPGTSSSTSTSNVQSTSNNVPSTTPLSTGSSSTISSPSNVSNLYHQIRDLAQQNQDLQTELQQLRARNRQLKEQLVEEHVQS